MNEFDERYKTRVGQNVISEKERKQSLAKLKSENAWAAMTQNPEVDERDMTLQQKQYREDLKRQRAGVVRPGVSRPD